MLSPKEVDEGTAEAENFAAVENVMRHFEYQEHGLVEVLIAAQETFGCLSKELMVYVSNKLHVPLSRVYGVATFYDMFTLEAVGETDCMICTGPACVLGGAKNVLEEVYKITGVSEPGQRSSDGRYRVNEVSCIGLCDQAPASLVNKRHPGNASRIGSEATLPSMWRTPHINRAHRSNPANGSGCS
jgi:bidirectional [NiFe] hydrogenase diaphorase subunit